MPEEKSSLDKVIDTVEKVVKDKSPKKEEKSSPWGWIAGLVAAAIGMLLVAALSWWASRKGRELAKLKHERDVREAKAHVDRVNAKLEENNVKVRRLEARAVKAEIEAVAIDAEIEDLETENKRIKDKIDAISDWGDIDRFLAGGASEGSD